MTNLTRVASRFVNTPLMIHPPKLDVMLQMLSVKAVASMLGALGGKSIRVRGQKFKEQGRWVLPLDQFDPAEYSPGRKEEHNQ